MRDPEAVIAELARGRDPGVEHERADSRIGCPELLGRATGQLIHERRGPMVLGDGGKITKRRVIYDPRPFLEMQPAADHPKPDAGET